jgi:hypothetical protein
VQGQLESITQQEQQLGERYGELSGRMEKTAEEREKTLAPMEAELQKQIAEPYPTRPHTELPQFKPEPIVNAKEYEALSYGLLAMAMLGGVASQGRWLEVGSSLNGALEGYLKGNMQNAQKRYEDYETQFKGAVAKEQQANKEFEDILTNKKLRLTDQMNLYKIAAAKYDRQDARAAAQSKNYDAMWRSLESNKTALLKIMDHNELVGATLAAKLNAGGTGGLSEKYKTDPQYKKNVDYWAHLLKIGGSLPPRFAQSGAGKLMMPDIIQVVPTLGGGSPTEMVANQLTRRQLNAEAQKIGTQSASVSIANAELQRFIPIAKERVDAVPRVGWKPINQLIQAGENTWSPEQGRLVIANRAVQNAFSQLIQRGAPTVHSLQEAETLLQTADSPAVYKAKLDQLVQEGVGAELGLKDAHDHLIERARAMGEDTPKGGDGSAAPPTNSKGWTLHKDAQGNSAYVNPDGTQFEEVK